MEKREEYRLPEAFVNKMRGLLGEEAEAFFKSYGESRRFGLRLNPLKGEPGEELCRLIRNMRPIPWCAGGYDYREEDRPGKHPLHEAGAYYIQEPSAMAVAEALKPLPGERILDLCAAPGGKTTHTAGKMLGKGLLVANEIHPARAKILSQNVERMGIGNAVVTNIPPEGLIPVFQAFFDGILVDAPCSGEGMFRKDEAAREEWSIEHVAMCAKRQEAILDCAAGMLRPGGRMVYSTCTFSPEENEQTVERFLESHPEFSLEDTGLGAYFSPGRPEWAKGTKELSKTIRIWPHKAGGEGHFLALFRKKEGEVKEKAKKDGKGRRKPLAGEEEAERFLDELLRSKGRLMEGKRLLSFGERLYLVPDETPPLEGLKVLRPGLQIGTQKKGRIEPSHSLALFLRKGEARQEIELGTGAVAEKYLRGETLSGEEVYPENIPESGWVLLTIDGDSVGFSKAAGGILKNHYPKGLRKP